MAFQLPSMISNTKQKTKLYKHRGGVPKGHLAVYVGAEKEGKKRYVVPLSFLSHPAFRDLLGLAEEEFGFHHPTGGLTIPCDEKTFIHVMNCRLNFFPSISCEAQ